ncbi:alpha/beta fold hydrolase [Marinilabilia rubra]|uniref:AB hydrolase-1 domain-containing protein n=1 Tax=Marinilabilia rubra TaxID=2162893 RepID=A0A2U2B9E3_9BACT|nr:alpha/beta hydrolase [Marinilabilia rubra]PWD99656.1 hypothetical protein DDZ16_09425 [Marinilabilia rubra]
MKKQNFIHTRFIEGKAGLPVLFLHGFLETGEVWLRWLSDYPLVNPLFVPDLPGHGQSKVWVGKSEFSGWAKTLLEIMDQEFSDNCDFAIAGHSMGGYLALEMARLYPDRVKKIVLFHSTPMPDMPGQTQSRHRQIDLIEKGRRQLLIKGVGPGMFAPENRDKLKETGEKLYKQAQSCTSEGMIKTLWTIMNRPDFVPVMRSRSKDILWVTGGKDPFMPMDHIEAVAKHFPKVKHKHFQDVGHAAFLEKPYEAMAVFKKFLD